jgi:hypothetical protein
MSVFIKQLLRDYKQLDKNSRIDLSVALDKLKADNRLSLQEEQIVFYLKSEFSFRETAKMLELDYSTFMRRVRTLCKKLSQILGDYYTDEYILKLVEKKLSRPLTPSERKFCLRLIARFGYKINKDISIYNFEQWLK